MPSRIEIDGVAYELGEAMLELVNCANRVAEFSLLLTAKHGETYWLTGTVEPAPRNLDDVVASRFRVGEPIETLFAALTGRRRPITPTNPGGVFATGRDADRGLARSAARRAISAGDSAVLSRVAKYVSA